MKLLDANLQIYVKNSFTDPPSSFMYFALIFSEPITITFFEKVLKVCENNFFQEI